MHDRGLIFFTEEFRITNVESMREIESPLEHHSNNYCKQDPLLFLYIQY